VIPIVILANDRFHDASIYESRPRPMALENGVVYEAQKTGVPVGYVTVTNGSNAGQGWVALAKWESVSQVQARKEKPKPTQPNTAAVDARPILHREGEGPQPTPTPTPAQTQPAPSDDTDRPILHRGTDNAQPAPTPAGQSTGQPASQPEAESPASEDPNRPVLRRRKPGTTDESDAVPTPSASNTRLPAATPAQPATTSPRPASASDTQTFVAVSDAESTDPRSFEYQWKPEEKTQIEEKMRKLALAQLPGENSPADEHAMTNVVVRSFDVDLSNDAVVVITAEVPGASLTSGKKAGRTSPGTKPASNKSVSRYVTVIARVDIDGNPQKLAASVTDSSRLDVAPRLELIDAVDVDGDGVAELLFREYDFDQKTFIIYGVGHGTVTKLFEGASEPLH
jgi:hypothetical protein